MTPLSDNRKAFLYMVAISEGTENIGDHGYNCIVGGALFDSYADHPRPHVWIKRIKSFSSAAGRYQILARFYDVYKVQLSLPDFSPDSQDKIALQLIRECHALPDIDEGRFYVAVDKCSSRWASLPGAGYGQKENSVESLKLAYSKAGGTVV